MGNSVFHYRFYFVTFLSVLFSILSLKIVSLDISFSWRWLSLILWVLAISIVPIYLFFYYRKRIARAFGQLFFPKKTLNTSFFILLFLAIVVSFLFLIQYPYIAIYDQIRGGGLYAQEIVHGSIKNFFGYDVYQSHGLIIPVITSFFLLFFHNSVLTFRFPDALLSVFDCLLLYVLSYKLIHKRVAFFSALILLFLPLHLYYARTEIVVFFSCFFTTLILFLTALTLRWRRLEFFALSGLVMGIATGFYDPVKTVSFLTIGILFSFCFYLFLKEKQRKHAILGCFLVLLFYGIGFGPKILFTTPAIFFHTNESFYSKSIQNTQSFSPLDIPIHLYQQKNILIKNYLNSLLVYVKEPTFSTHYPDFKPILDPILSIFFLIGFFVTLFFRKSLFLKIICVYALLLPLTNSALTNALNSDNRLLPLLPVTAILTSYGIYVVLSWSSKLHYGKHLQRSLTIIFTVFICLNGSFFFFEEPATKQYTSYDYLSMDVIYFMQSHPLYANAPKVCIVTPSSEFQRLSAYGGILLHQEQYNYFLPGKTIAIYEGKSIPENTFYVSYSCMNATQTSYQEYTYCHPYQKFFCPHVSPLTLYVEKEHEFPLHPTMDFFTRNPLILNPIPQYIP